MITCMIRFEQRSEQGARLARRGKAFRPRQRPYCGHASPLYLELAMGGGGEKIRFGLGCHPQQFHRVEPFWRQYHPGYQPVRDTPLHVQYLCGIEQFRV